MTTPHNPLTSARDAGVAVHDDNADLFDPTGKSRNPDVTDGNDNHIADIQRACTHPLVAMEQYSYGANTEGEEWVWCNCGLCGKSEMSVPLEKWEEFKRNNIPQTSGGV